jgi:hypothetical protein
MMRSATSEFPLILRNCQGCKNLHSGLRQKPGTFVLIQSLNFNLFWSDSSKGRVVGAARIEALARKAVMKDMPQFSAFRAIKGQPAQGKTAASFTQELP